MATDNTTFGYEDTRGAMLVDGITNFAAYPCFAGKPTCEKVIRTLEQHLESDEPEHYKTLVRAAIACVKAECDEWYKDEEGE